MENLKHFLANLSHHPGIYQMLGEQSEVLYVGKAKDLKKRVSSYFNRQTKDPKTLSLLSQIKNIEVTITHSENEAVLLECNLIKQHKPRYNILLRDDKSYPYIIFSHHPYPRIDLYRGQRKKNGYYFGPYPSALAARETISLLQKLFLLRTCDEHFFATRRRPCLLYQIGRCSGPCVNLISEEEYARNVQLALLFMRGKSDEVIHLLQSKMEQASQQLDYELAASFRDQIARLRQIQERQHVNVADGEADILGLSMQGGICCLQLLSVRHGQILGSRSYFPIMPPYATTEEILTAFVTQHYLAQHPENIPKQIIIEKKIPETKLLTQVLTHHASHPVHLFQPLRGEKKTWLKMAITNAKQALTTRLFSKMNMQERLLALQKTLALKQLPKRIECFDISHSHGEATVASCVVFDQQGPLKQDYRRFNISNITPGDDIAAMQQVLQRRFKRLQKEAQTLPDIVFIDGGIAQLATAKKALADLNLLSVLIIGVSKGPKRKRGYETLHYASKRFHLSSDSHALHLIQQIRDEAHRFAITGHRQRRDSTRRHSSLESIPGIGTKRRRELLRYFGGIQGLAHASLDELQKVPGINRSLAERIFTSLHDATI